MKKCMICGWDEHDDSMFTCPACGEATWGLQKAYSAEPAADIEPSEAAAPVEAAEVAAPVKRGPGRPRKNP